MQESDTIDVQFGENRFYWSKRCILVPAERHTVTTSGYKTIVFDGLPAPGVVSRGSKSARNCACSLTVHPQVGPCGRGEVYVFSELVMHFNTYCIIV